LEEGVAAAVVANGGGRLNDESYPVLMFRMAEL
jgi:hypothetical protein